MYCFSSRFLNKLYKNPQNKSIVTEQLTMVIYQSIVVSNRHTKYFILSKLYVKAEFPPQQKAYFLLRTFQV